MGIDTYVFKYLEKPKEGIGARIELEVQGVYAVQLRSWAEQLFSARRQQS